MNTTEIIEAVRQLCADLDAAHRYIGDLEAEIRVLRNTDANTNYAALWREAQKMVDAIPDSARLDRAASIVEYHWSGLSQCLRGFAKTVREYREGEAAALAAQEAGQ